MLSPLGILVLISNCFRGMQLHEVPRDGCSMYLALTEHPLRLTSRQYSGFGMSGKTMYALHVLLSTAGLSITPLPTSAVTFFVH